MVHEAIILAGGIGTRLKEKVSDIPKPMAPIKDKPFLEYLLNYITGEGIKKVVLSVGYKHETIINYFGNNYKGIEIDYAVESNPLGTGGAISLSLEKCQLQNVFIINGDTFFPISLTKLQNNHIDSKVETTLALKKISPADRYGTVKLDNQSNILSFEEKKPLESGLINGGIYIINKNKFGKRIFPEKYSFEKDYLEYAVDENCIAGTIFDDYFLDIGIPETFIQAQTELPKLFPISK